MEPVHPSTNKIPDNAFKSLRVLMAFKNTLLPFAFLWVFAGGLYGGTVVYLATRFELEPFEIPDATLLFFLLAFYAAAGLHHMNMHLTNLRVLQGTNHSLYFKIRSYLDDNHAEAQVFAIRDLIIASEMTVLGPLAGLEIEVLALAHVLALLPDDLPDTEKEVLNKLLPTGGPASDRMLFIASQRFNAAMPGAGECFSQVQQRLEIENLLLKVRGTLATISDAVADGAVHIAYTQVLSIIVLVYLLMYPWSLGLDYGYWTVLSSSAQFLSVSGVYCIAGEMFIPYTGYVKINMKSVFMEIETGWARWANYN
jgi:hypothetical protein